MVRLKLGGTYRRRDGVVVDIVDNKAGKASSTQRYKCSEGKRYDSYGRWKKDASHHEWDLVEEVTKYQPVRATPAPQAQRPAERRYEAPAPAPRYEAPAPAYPAYQAPAPTNNTTTTKKGNTMSSTISKLFGGGIGQVTDANFRMSFQGPAVRVPDGGYVTYNAATKQLTDVSDFVLDDAEQFLYKLPATSVKPGDTVVISEAPLDVIYVTEVRADGSVEGINPRTSRREVWVPKNNIFGIKFFITLTSLVNFGGLAGGDASFQNILPLLALTGGLGGDKGDTSSMLPLLLMGGLGGNAAGGQQNALLPLLLMGGLGGKNGKSNSMVEMMMLSSLAGGGNASPFGNIFGGAAAPAAAAPAAAEH